MNRAIKRLRAFLIGVIKEGVAPPIEQKPKPISGHVRLLRLTAGASLVADIGIERAAQAVGEDPEELRRWLSRHRVRR